MKTRRLGNSDLNITPIGLGAWAMGGADWQFGWGRQNDADSIAAIHRAIELGINWIDTAAFYGLGHSEEVVANALEHWPGPRPYIFTKCARIWNEKRQIGTSLKAASIRRECENSLRRLRIDTIDLYQIHWPAADPSETDEGWAELANLQKQGKARWIGVSNFNRGQLRRAQALAPITSLQPPYSLIRREVEAEILPYCQQTVIGVIVYSPMASGLLSGTMTRERVAALPAEYWRTRSPEFMEPKLSQNLAEADRLRSVSKRHGCSPGEVAIAWTLRHPAVTGAIVGARNAKQLDGVIRGADLQLTTADTAEIEG